MSQMLSFKRIVNSDIKHFKSLSNATWPQFIVIIGVQNWSHDQGTDAQCNWVHF